jgi:deoxyribodipyrimidine photolyase-related protein
MKYFADHLPLQSKYIDYSTFQKSNYNFLKTFRKGTVNVIDPTDTDLLAELENFCNKNKLTLVVHETPLFLTPKSALKEYVETTKRPYFHKTFYAWQLKRLNVPGISKSYDTENRKSLPKSIQPPSLPKGDEETEYVHEATKYVQTNFPKAFGNPETPMSYPITPSTARRWLHHFLETKLNKFGTYQDALSTATPTLYHSVLSSSINIGLLDPKEVLEETIVYCQKHNVGINNYEGFVRQLIGWREYERMLYLFYGQELRTSNYFNNQRKLPKKGWYLPDPEMGVGIEPLDNAIRQVYDTAYLHHIQRLMVVLNFMTLTEISPDEIYRWFMATTIDAYDWVMVGNVYSMGYANPKTMTKPYISGSNYILKMSGMTKSNREWTDIWDGLFYQFILRHENQLPFYKRLLPAWRRKSEEERRRLKTLASKYLEI